MRRRNCQNCSQKKVNEYQDTDEKYECQYGQLRHANVQGETAYKREYVCLEPPKEKTEEKDTIYRDRYVPTTFVPIRYYLTRFLDEVTLNSMSDSDCTRFAKERKHQTIEYHPETNAPGVFESELPQGGFKFNLGVREEVSKVREEVHADAELAEERFKGLVRRRLWGKSSSTAMAAGSSASTQPFAAAEASEATVPMKLDLLDDAANHSNCQQARLALGGLPGSRSACAPARSESPPSRGLLGALLSCKTGPDDLPREPAISPPPKSIAASAVFSEGPHSSAAGGRGAPKKKRELDVSPDDSVSNVGVGDAKEVRAVKFLRKGSALPQQLAVAEQLMQDHQEDYCASKLWNNGLVFPQAALKNEKSKLTRASGILAGAKVGEPEQLKKAASLALELYNAAEEVGETHDVLAVYKTLQHTCLETPLSDKNRDALMAMGPELVRRILSYVAFALAAKTDCPQEYVTLLKTIKIQPDNKNTLSLSFFLSFFDGEDGHEDLRSTREAHAIQTGVVQVLSERILKSNVQKATNIVAAIADLIPNGGLLPKALADAGLGQLKVTHGWFAQEYTDLVSIIIYQRFAAMRTPEAKDTIPLDVRHAALDFLANYGRLSLRIKALMKTHAPNIANENIACKAFKLMSVIQSMYGSLAEAENNLSHAWEPQKEPMAALSDAVHAMDMKAAYNAICDCMDANLTDVIKCVERCPTIEATAASAIISELQSFANDATRVADYVLASKDFGAYVSAVAHGERSVNPTEGTDTDDEFEWLCEVGAACSKTKAAMQTAGDERHAWCEVEARLAIIGKASALNKENINEKDPVALLKEWSQLYGREQEILPATTTFGDFQSLSNFMVLLRKASIGPLITQFLCRALREKPDKEQALVNCAETLKAELPKNTGDVVRKYRAYSEVKAMLAKIHGRKNPGIIEVATVVQSSEMLHGVVDNEIAALTASTVRGDVEVLQKEFGVLWAAFQAKSILGTTVRLHERYKCVLAAADAWNFEDDSVSFLKLAEAPPEAKLDNTSITKVIQTFPAQQRVLESLTQVLSANNEIKSEATELLTLFRKEEQKFSDFAAILQVCMYANIILSSVPNKATLVLNTTKYLSRDLLLADNTIPPTLKTKLKELGQASKEDVGASKPAAADPGAEAGAASAKAPAGKNDEEETLGEQDGS